MVIIKLNLILPNYNYIVCFTYGIVDNNLTLIWQELPDIKSKRQRSPELPNIQQLSKS